ncbi:MAG: MopE-related protein [Pseudomonadota bacterium]
MLARAALLALLLAPGCLWIPKEDSGGPPDAADADGDGYTTVEDCDDDDAAVHPGASELCDGVDNDCDGTVDEADAEDAPTWYADADGDGYGVEAYTQQACAAPEDHVDTAGDCNDSDSEVNPGATERCDGVDNDCDDETDEADAEDASTWYYDGDGDGYGLDGQTTVACAQPGDHAPEGGDCDDADTAYHPGAPEDDCTDPNDYNCDGSVGYADEDGDGWAACAECDDSDAAIHPDAAEVCNDTDDDCDGLTDDDDDSLDTGTAATWYADTDSDGYGDAAAPSLACDQPTGSVADSTDCDDTTAAVHPGAAESCNGIDDDCDGTTDEDDASDAATWYADADADGYGDPAASTAACAQPTGYLADATDCDDTAAAVNPGASESCNGVDDDCDGTTDEDDAVDAGTWYADADGDGYGDAAVITAACTVPSGYVADATDCDDTTTGVNPGATEVCDSADDDCDGDIDDADSGLDTSTARTWYADADSDGYGDASSPSLACDQPSGAVTDSTDCDDTTAGVNPGATEVCNGTDDDCDGDIDDADSSLDTSSASTWYADEDGDGYGVSSSTALSCTAPASHASVSGDCDDGHSAVNPGAAEYCNGVDDNCDGDIDESTAIDATTWYRDLDSDGWGDTSTATADCGTPSGYIETDGDCDDSDGAVHPGADEYCNGVDDNCDGDIDEGTAIDAATWYQDLDADGWGDTSSTIADCGTPSGYTDIDGDCDDGDASMYPGQWVLTGSIDGAPDLAKLTESSDGTIWLGTVNDGRLFETTDGGDTWNGVVDLGVHAWHVIETESGVLLAATGSDGKVYSSIDGGATWSDLGCPNGQSYNEHMFTLLEPSPGTVFVGTYETGVYYTEDEGSSWTYSGLNSTDYVHGLFYTSGGNLLAGARGGGGRGEIHVSTDLGGSWSGVSVGSSLLDYIEGFTETETGDLFAVGYGDSDIPFVYLSVDGGLTWSNTAGIGSGMRAYSIVQVDGRVYVGTGPDGGIYFTEDDGGSWQLFSAPFGSGMVGSMIHASDGYIWATNRPGEVYRVCP